MQKLGQKQQFGRNHGMYQIVRVVGRILESAEGLTNLQHVKQIELFGIFKTWSVLGAATRACYIV